MSSPTDPETATASIPTGNNEDEEPNYDQSSSNNNNSTNPSTIASTPSVADDGITAASAGIMYNPELIHNTTFMTSSLSSSTPAADYNNNNTNNNVNLSDPEALEAHLQVLDVRQRLRARRRRAIRFFTCAFAAVVVILMAGLGSTMFRSTFQQEDDSQQQQQQQGSAAGGGTIAASQPGPPNPPSDLVDKCSVEALRTTDGIRQCETICEVADCCTIPPTFVLSCQTPSNADVCSQYQQVCGVLDHIFGDDTTNDSNSSSNSNNNNGDTSQIESVDGTVGDGQDSDSTSNNNDTTGSEENQDGGNSNNSNNNGAAGSSSLATQIQRLCGQTPIEAIEPPPTGENQDSTNTCEGICSISYCCFNQICKPPPDMDCADYAPCYMLYAEDTDSMTNQMDGDETGEGTATTIGDTIHAACSDVALDVNEASSNTECQSVCSPGACCFEDHLSCTNVDCAAYAECIVLHPSYVSVTKAEVDDACNNHNDANLATNGQPSLCEQVCTLHVMQCCFHVGGECHDSILQGDNISYCSTYESCAVLGTDGSALSQSHKDELEEACTGGPTSRSKCIQFCSAATCCYSTTIEESCVNVDTSISCDDYKACDVLYG